MSLDISIGDYEGNYTYNLAPVWYDVYPNDEGMVDIDGQTGLTAYYKLTYAIDKILSRYPHLLKHNPPNGWGDLDGFIMFLCRLRLESIKHPNKVWSSWR